MVVRAGTIAPSSWKAERNGQVEGITSGYGEPRFWSRQITLEAQKEYALAPLVVTPSERKHTIRFDNNHPALLLETTYGSRRKCRRVKSPGGYTAKRKRNQPAVFERQWSRAKEGELGWQNLNPEAAWIARWASRLNPGWFVPRTNEEEKLSHGEKQRLWIEAQMQCTSRDDATTIRRKNGCFKKPCGTPKLHSIVLFMVAYRLARNYHSRPKQLAADEDVALEAVLVFNIVYCEC